MASDIREEALDYYQCYHCNTIVPCPLNHNGIERPCPSCGVLMDVVSENIAAARSGLLQDTNFPGILPTAWGGRNGGFGLGPGGNLICPSCRTVIPHKRGVPAYNVNCPKCGSIMQRQLPANIPTAFYDNIFGSRNSFNNNAPPITSNAVMTHAYRGVCSACHQIVDLQNSQSGYTPVGGQLYPYSPIR